RRSDLRLVIAGGAGWGQREATAAVAAARHHDRITMTGYVDEAVKPSLLRRAAAVCYPSLAEGFGLPALEAMACGAPLVTTVGTAMEEVAGDAALLVAPGDVDGLAEALDAAVGSPHAEQRSRGLAAASTF